MTILVCSLSRVSRLVFERSPERVVSLLDPGRTFPDLGLAYAGKHLRLEFHDVHLAESGDTAPTAEHVDALLSFTEGWQRSGPLLVHCRAGIGRSTAVAFIAACQHNPHTDERAIARALRRAGPLSRPNMRLVELADAALGRAGRLCRAIEDTAPKLAWPELKAALSTTGEGSPFELPSRF